MSRDSFLSRHNASDPRDIGWHLDGGYEDPADVRTRWMTVRARGGGLLALFLFSDVDEDSAPTRLRAGSHLDSVRVLAAAGEKGLESGEAARQAGRVSAHRRTALATGQAGDVFLCHQLMDHSASWPHRGRVPRLTAQPSVALLGEYRLPGLPAVPPTPVEQAVLRTRRRRLSCRWPLQYDSACGTASGSMAALWEWPSGEVLAVVALGGYRVPCSHSGHLNVRWGRLS
jgi:hypothetical protein